VDGDVQDQPYLVGKQAAAVWYDRRQAGLVQFDEVLGLAARAVETHSGGGFGLAEG
jgi:hypothetical protein